MIDREAQHELEVQSDTVAAAARLAELRQAAADGDPDTSRSTRIVGRVYSAVEAHLEVAKNTLTRGMGGKYKTWLRALPLDVAAVIAVRECISKCSSVTHNRPVLVQDLAGTIGKLWETEVRIREAEAVNPMYMQKIHEQVKENCTTSQSHLRKLYNVAYERVMKGELEANLSKSDLIQIGKFGVDACLQAGLLEVHRATSSKGTLVHYTLTEAIQEYLHSYSTQDVNLVTDKMAGAMLCPPDAWENTTDGGYVSMRRKMAYPLLKLSTIRSSERARIYEEFTAANMPIVFRAANYLQDQEYTLHMPTLNAIRRIWTSGGGVMGIPKKDAPERPECPLPKTWIKEDGTPEEAAVFTDWKRRVLVYYTKMREWRGKVREIGGFLRVVHKYNGSVWFPGYFDSRGRWYYRGTPNPQGSDLAKAVICFAKRKPLGKDGLFWLKVHVANAMGFDTERFADRARWTEQNFNWEHMAHVLDNPEDYPEAFGTDGPWCVFAAAWELREAYRSGNPEEYCTGQIVHMDATCSGLQHFAAILRDPIGGTYVNLNDDTGCGPKQDIYARVANNALRAMQRDLQNEDPEVREMAEWWIQTGISRKLAKHPVMTYVYGATLRGTTQHIESMVSDEMPDVHWPTPTVAYKYSQYCAKKLFMGIAATVPAATDAMRWLREMTRQQPVGQRMVWSTPIGFKVQHDYQTFDEVRISLRSCGVSKVLVRNYNEGTNPSQMQNAVAPNFVHALDATHMMLTALRMQEGGASMVSIHDSFGTHACDVQSMHTCIRESFIELYQGRNILGEFLWDIGGIGEPPMRGTLDLNDVRTSEFFFC